MAYRRQGHYREWFEADRMASLYWDPGGTATKDLEKIFQAYSDSGERGFWLATIEFDEKHRVQQYYLAMDYARLGKNEQALQMLQKSFAARELVILGLQNDPEFDPLRSDRRFQRLVRAVGLKQ